MSSLSKSFRLNDSKVFRDIYKNGSKWVTPSFAAFYKMDKELKVAFIASKKVGKAVVRNRLKRKLKGAFLAFDNKIKPGFYIFVARSSLKDRLFNDIKKDFEITFKRLKLF